MTRTAIHSGTLDPITNGHAGLVHLWRARGPRCAAGAKRLRRHAAPAARSWTADRFRTTTPRPRMLGPLVIALTLLDL